MRRLRELRIEVPAEPELQRRATGIPTATVADLDEEYIEKMEDVLETYEKPLSSAEPVVCVDEKPVTLHKDVREPIPMKPGSVANALSLLSGYDATGEHAGAVIRRFADLCTIMHGF